MFNKEQIQNSMFITNIQCLLQIFELNVYNYQSLSVRYCSLTLIFKLDGYNYRTQQKTAINMEFNFGLDRS